MVFPIYMAAQNPIINHMYSADPSARVFGDRLWLYPSHDKDDALKFSMEDYHAYSTSDMRVWQDHGTVFNPIAQTTWAKEAAWAPDCISATVSIICIIPLTRSISALLWATRRQDLFTTRSVILSSQ